MLEELLGYRPKYFQWAGADLIHVTNEKDSRHMAVIENNSCQSLRSLGCSPGKDKTPFDYQVVM